MSIQKEKQIPALLTCTWIPKVWAVDSNHFGSETWFYAWKSKYSGTGA